MFNCLPLCQCTIAQTRIFWSENTQKISNDGVGAQHDIVVEVKGGKIDGSPGVSAIFPK